MTPENARPSLAVITPSYNQGQYIERTINSVLEQDSGEVDYVVFDGGSTDDTIDVLKRYENRLRWVSEPDRGQTDAVNKGLAATDSEIIGWLNSDDVYYPGAFAAVLDVFARRPEVDVVYGESHYIDSDDQVIRPFDALDWDFERLKSLCYICQPATFFRRRVVEQFGSLDVNLQYIMDYEFWLRLAAGGAVFHRHRDWLSHGMGLAGYRLYPETKTRSARVPIHLEIAEVQRRMFGRVADDWVIGYAYAWAQRRFGDQMERARPIGRQVLKRNTAMGALALTKSLAWNRRLSRPVIRAGAQFVVQGVKFSVPPSWRRMAKGKRAA